jgi:acetyl esterase/lipase
MRTRWFFCILVPAIAISQQDSVHIPRDTSFTIASAAASIRSRYPFARIVTPNLPRGVRVSRDIVYASYGKRELHLDLFRPEESGKGLCPAVIMIHGGGWRSGDRSLQVPLALHLASRGYAAAVIEYRLSLEAHYPAAVHDVKAAIRWMRARSPEYAIDTTRIAVSGCSAGGQLAALVGTTNDDPRFEGKGNNGGHSSSVQAIVDVDGILDFRDPAESGKDTIPGKLSAGAAWFGATYKENPALWIEASPLMHVSKDDPPIAFINSSLKRFHAGRDEMVEKLKTYSIYYEIHTIPDTPHPFWLFHPWFEPTCDYISEFLDRTLRGSSQTQSTK